MIRRNKVEAGRATGREVSLVYLPLSRRILYTDYPCTAVLSLEENAPPFIGLVKIADSILFCNHNVQLSTLIECFHRLADWN
jgi:hypothetical protein